jgi:uncharacterized protein YndB with AHSA1/START domain
VKRLAARRTIDAPRERVWELMTDVDAWPQWGPSIQAGRLDVPDLGLAEHATGTVTVLGGITLRFVITEYSAGRSWAWDVAGVPATRHHVEDRADAVTRRSTSRSSPPRTWRSAASVCAASDTSPSSPDWSPHVASASSALPGDAW